MGMKPRPKRFYVEIVRFEGEVVKVMGPFAARRADAIERGLSINLDHTRYFTRVR